MASRAEVLDQITDISVRVLGCDEDAVGPQSRFSELGSDSLTIVEIGEELGRRFDVYLSDDTIDTMRTVQDAMDSVLSLTAAAERAAAAQPAATRPATSQPTTAQPAARSITSPRPIAPVQTPHVKRKAFGAIIWMAIIGVLVGGGIGFGLSAMVSATGIKDVALPPLNATTATPTPTKTTPAPKPKPTQTDDPTPEPTLNAESTQVAPGERFVLSGAFPDLDEGTVLQVQVREKGTGWDDFPITTMTRADGRFKTELYTSRTGEREFRLLAEASGTKTPTVKVQIG